MKVTECLEQRVLVTVGGSTRVHMTVPGVVSPSGKYVHLHGFAEGADEALGWWAVDDVEVLEVLQPAEETFSQLRRRSQDAKLAREEQR